MSGYIPNIIKQAARDLRKNMTKSEKQLWDEIKNRKLGHKFLRQKPIYLYTEDRGHDRYIIPDFCCLELKIIIEVDGKIHDKQDIFYQDKEKKKLLKNKGFNILRFKNEEIEINIQNILKRIEKSFP